MNNRPIGIFDSGVGGLTVFKEIRQLLPNEDVVYFGDTARVPYGAKSVEAVRRFSNEIFSFLKRQDIKMLVVACNTASALALGSLKQTSDIPIVGVIEPGVRAALRAAHTGPIGIIGTKATISSAVYQNLIYRYRSEIKVAARACPLLVPIIEENLLDSDIAWAALKMYLTDIKRQNVKALILACTHYPLLKPLISKFFGGETVLVDSAAETALEVFELIKARRLLSNSLAAGKETFYVSDDPHSFSQIASAFLGRPLGGRCLLHTWQNED